MGALVLGLLVASAKGSFDAQTTELTLVLDRILDRSGAETKDARASLRNVAKQKCWISRGQRNVSGPPGWTQLA